MDTRSAFTALDHSCEEANGRKPCRAGGDGGARVRGGGARLRGRDCGGGEALRPYTLSTVSSEDGEDGAAVAKACVPTLVQLLSRAEAVAADAAVALTTLSGDDAADNESSKDAIREAGGIAPLVTLLAAGANSEVATKAAGALSCLGGHGTALPGHRRRALRYWSAAAWPWWC